MQLPVCSVADVVDTTPTLPMGVVLKVVGVVVSFILYKNNIKFIKMLQQKPTKKKKEK